MLAKKDGSVLDKHRVGVFGQIGQANDLEPGVAEGLLVGGMLQGGPIRIDRLAVKMRQRAIDNARADLAGEGEWHEPVVTGAAQKKRAIPKDRPLLFRMKTLSASRTGSCGEPWPGRTSYARRRGCRGSGSLRASPPCAAPARNATAPGRCRA